MAENPFLQPREFYQRDIAPVKNYVNQMTKAMMLANNLSEQEARQLVIDVLKNKESQGINDPVVEFFGRDANGDRTKERMPLTHYLRDVVQNRQILVPTLTAYVHPSEDKSPVSEFIQANVKLRSAGKKSAQKAKNEGQVEQAFFWDTYQKNKKENNNSMSGAFATESSTFVNETGHNTLTSITRSMASIGNALNERIIGGNRHYRSVDIVFNNILAIVTTMDKAMVDEAIHKFNLHQPTAEEALSVLMDSLRYYTFDERTKKELRKLLAAMSPAERCAVSYTQDLYHLRQYNEAFVRGFIDDLSRIDTNFHVDDPIKAIYDSGELTINYAHQVLIEQVKGKGKDYNKADKFDPALLQLLAGVCTNINQMVEKYRPLINAFFLTRTVPCSTAYIQDMVRQNVVLSDTDSTMFSVDEWVNWYFGHLTFSQHAFGVAGAVMFLSTQCIAHCLAILSANMGVADEHLYTLAMKPEFVFPVFGQSPVSKHYFTAILVQEGSVYEDIHMEIKGVHNKSSAQPVSIIEPAQKRMEDIIRQVMAGKKISLKQEIEDVVKLEQHIIQSLRNGSSEFLKRMNIKESGAYSKGPTESNYAWYTCWKEVFEPKYGAITPPPYDALKIPTIISSPTSWKTFVDTIQDKEFVKRLQSWMESHNKKILKTFYISMDYVEANGIPEEILEIVDYKRIVLDLTNIRRMLLDTLGYILREDYMLIETL